MKTVHEFFVALQKLGLPAHPSLSFKPYPISKEDPHWYLCGHTVTREQDVNDLLVMHANRHFKLRCVTLEEVVQFVGITDESYLVDVLPKVYGRYPRGFLNELGRILGVNTDALKVSHLRGWVEQCGSKEERDLQFFEIRGVGRKTLDACLKLLGITAAHP